MNQVQVEIVQLQVFERLLAGGNHVLFIVLVVPQLRSDPQVFALDAGLHGFAERLPDQMLVAVDGGAVDVAITNLNRAFDGFGNRFG